MELFRKLFQRRQNPRFYPCKGTYLIIAPYAKNSKEPNHINKIEIIDISAGGCAFIYDGSSKSLMESGLLSLFLDGTPHVDSVDFVTASDNPLPTNHDNSVKLRRRGLEFRWLGTFNKERLKSFIEKISIGCTP